MFQAMLCTCICCYIIGNIRYEKGSLTANLLLTCVKLIPALLSALLQGFSRLLHSLTQWTSRWRTSSAGQDWGSNGQVLLSPDQTFYPPHTSPRPLWPTFQPCLWCTLVYLLLWSLLSLMLAGCFLNCCYCYSAAPAAPTMTATAAAAAASTLLMLLLQLLLLLGFVSYCY